MVGTFDLEEENSKIIGFPKKFVYSVFTAAAAIGVFVAYMQLTTPTLTSTKYIDDLNNDSIKEKVITYSPARKDTLYSSVVCNFQSEVVDTIYVKDSYSTSYSDSVKISVPELTPLILLPEVKSLNFDYNCRVPVSSNSKLNNLNSLDSLISESSLLRKFELNDFVLEDIELK